MIDFRFLVARNDIKGTPGLEKGAPVVRVAVEVAPGGYEYDVWHRLDDGMTAKTRIEHRGEFMACEIDGFDTNDCRRKALEVASGMRSGGGDA